MDNFTNYNQRMQEIQAEQAEKNRQEETPAVRSAREAHERAQDRLKLVTEPGRGYRNYSYEDREEAKKDAAEKEKEYRKVSNDAARELRINKQAAEKKARDDARAAEEAKQAAAYEERTKQSYRLAWKGDDKSFTAAWPGIWQQHLVTEAQEQVNQTRAGLLARGEYSKF
jgi:hypothetical protein